MKMKNGKPFSFITDAKQFTSYSDAEKFITDNQGYMIVGNHPLKSPIPLPSVQDYELVYGSSQKTDNLSLVKIFKRVQ